MKVKKRTFLIILAFTAIAVFLLLTQYKNLPSSRTEGAFCGGIAGVSCPFGYFCQMDAKYPDAEGRCKKVDFTKKTGNNDCIIAGCSNELCVDKNQEVASICIFKDEYACFKDAVCEKQQNGKCAWTQTEKSQACLGRLQKK